MSHMYSYIIPGPGPGQSGRAPCVKEWENERSMVVDHGTAGAAPHVYTTCCPAWCRTTRIHYMLPSMVPHHTAV